MSSASNTLIFISGAAIGSLVTWQLVKEKYKQYANEEIELIRTHYREKLKKEKEKNYSEPVMDLNEYERAKEQSKQSLEKADISEYADRIRNLNYSSFSAKDSKQPEKKKEFTSDIGRIYSISPDEFGSDDDYDIVTMTYYADGVLVDELDAPIEDIEATIGNVSISSSFGEYEPDSVYIRNETLKIDYEILRDLQRYEDVFNIKQGGD